MRRNPLATRRGATLVEILIYSVILMLILASVYAAYSLARDYYSAAQIETEAQQAAIDASLGVARELAHASADTIVLTDSPPAITFLSAKTDEGPFLHHETTAELLWHRWHCIYLDTNDHKLKLLEIKLDTPTSEIPETAPTVGEFLADSSLEEFILGRDITEFTHEITGRNTVWFQVRSSLQPTRVASGHTAPENATTEIVLATEVPIRQ